MTADPLVRNSVAVADPTHPDHFIQPNADGSINITGSISATSAAVATAASPTYSEGVSEPLSQDLSGNLRALVAFPATLAVTQSGTWTVGISASQTIAVTNTGTFAVQAAQTGTWTVGISAAQSVAVTNAGTFAVQAAGPTASGSSLTASPLTVGARAATANPTAVTDGQVVNLMADKEGHQVIVIGNVRDLKANQYTALSSASETTIVTQIGSTFNDLYGIIAANTTASAVTLTFKDSTAGTTQFSLYVPANDTRGFILPSSDGFKQGTVNTNWTCTGGASGVNISALYVKNI